LKNHTHAERKMKNNPSVLRQLLQPAVIVGALGYFVDVYDLILFAILRIPSLKDMEILDHTKRI
jgi:hypothetical protein